ncbi:DNA primase large subunit-like [Amphiura filiformis]|uniref:DNA primase large subunit-like n=1 Tax=Amphiura filiformis TaxID=82378 RepID=UPI003B2227A0
MQFGGERKRQRRKNVRLTGSRRENANLYPHRLQFYRIPPIDNITLNEFEDFAINRLKVLKVVERVGIKHIRGREEYNQALDIEFRKLKLMPVVMKHSSSEAVALTDEEYDSRRMDHISHFILRLAYCRSEDLRRWFIAQELDLFRYRFLNEKRDQVAKFLEANDLNYKPIPQEETERLLPKLIASSRDPNPLTLQSSDFYKVPFTEALDLVRGRKVYLEKGWAYVPHSDLVSIIISAYRAHLSHALAVTARGIPHLEEDDRLLPLLTNLSKQYLGEDYGKKTTATGNIRLEDMDSHARTSFPLCMRQLHVAFREHHHLKHWGRQQYGLFVKGIGVTLEQAMRYWRAEFTKLIDVDKFEKQYAYNIRHNYGQEGKRTNYTPYSCMKIIMTNAPAAGDYHGCPFRHNDAHLLKQRLASYKVSQSGIEEIMDLVNRSHYQLACSKYFEVTHKVEEGLGISIQHPNQYFVESQKLLGGGKTATVGGTGWTPRPSQQSTQSQQTPNSQLASQSQGSSAPNDSVCAQLEEDFDDAEMLEASTNVEVSQS